MLNAAVKALSQILSPPMRSILWRSIGLAVVLIVVLAFALQRLLSWFATSGQGWAEAMLGPGFETPLNVLAWIVSIAAGLGVVFGAVLLMPAITSLVASVFVDEVAEHVEIEHYPAERPGVALPFGLAMTEGIKTALRGVPDQRSLSLAGEDGPGLTLCSPSKSPVRWSCGAARSVAAPARTVACACEP